MRWGGRVAAGVVVAAAGAASCQLDSDPYQGWPCVTGHERIDGKACRVTTVAAIVVDGDTAEWVGVPDLVGAGQCLAPPCEGLLPAAVQAAATLDEDRSLDDIGVRVRLADGAAPLRDVNVRYVIRFSTTAERPTELAEATLLFGMDGTDWTLDGVPVDVYGIGSARFEVIFTPDGLEYRGFLWPPVRGAADVAVWTERRVAGQWTPVATASGEARVCWLADDAGHDPCRVEP